jgi:hypothetical protein
LGEGKAGEHEEAGLVTRRWAAVVSRGRTLEEEGKEAQTLYDLAEELRDELRAIEWADDGTLEWTDYEGLEVAESEGLAAWQVRFSTGHKL